MKNVGCRSRRKPPLSFAEDENDLTCFEHKINLLKPFSNVLCSVVMLGVFGSLSNILHLTVIFSQTKLSTQCLQSVLKRHVHFCLISSLTAHVHGKVCSLSKTWLHGQPITEQSY